MNPLYKPNVLMKYARIGNYETIYFFINRKDLYSDKIYGKILKFEELPIYKKIPYVSNFYFPSLDLQIEIIPESKNFKVMSCSSFGIIFTGNLFDCLDFIEKYLNEE